MRKNKLLLASIALVISSQSHAETIHCDGIAPYSESLNMTIDYDSASGQMGAVKLAHADGSSYLSTVIGPFQRSKQDGIYVYTETFPGQWAGDNSNANTLIIQTNTLSGSTLKSMLSMPLQGFSSIPMTCSVKGQPAPAEPLCPAKSQLNDLLIKASRVGAPSEVESLLACGADANAKDERGCTPLLIVSDLGCGYHSSASSDPLDPNVSIRPTGSRSIFVIDRLVALLARAGADVETQDPVNFQTALHMAAKYSNSDAARILAQLDAGINAQDIDGNTPLMLAAETGSVFNVKTILEFSPNRSLKNKQGMTAYDIAKEFDARDVVDLLRPVTKTITLQGGINGGCDQTMIHVMQGEEIEIALQATSSKMFKLDAPDLGIDLMAMPGETVKQTITPAKQGTFPFVCGVHGAPDTQQTHGKFMVM